MLARWRVPPPLPLVYWNHRVGVKMRSNPRGICGQNLDVKELSGRNRGRKLPGRDDAVSARTVTASVMIGDCDFEVKVARHKGAVEKNVAASIQQLCELRGVFGLGSLSR
jgi:hypothetical protein